MAILFTEVTPDDAAYFAQRFPDEPCIAVAGPLTGDALAALENPETIDTLSVMVHSKVDASVLDALPGLKCIAARSTGFDHIDVAAAKAKGIVVCHVPAYGSNTVAEHTFALILSLARKVHKAYLRTLQGEFHLDGLMGMDLARKTLGVVGAGRIGQHVLRIGDGFGMRTIAYDPFPDSQLEELLDFEYVPFDTLLERSDVVAICCPLTPQTHHLFDRAAFAKLKPGALLVNTARGAVVEAGALLWALHEGILAGAGLDVLEGEEMLSEDALVGSMAHAPGEGATLIAENLTLMRHPNLLVTPHMAFFSREALHRILETTAGNIDAFRAGAPTHRVPEPPR